MPPSAVTLERSAPNGKEPSTVETDSSPLDELDSLLLVGLGRTAEAIVRAVGNGNVEVATTGSAPDAARLASRMRPDLVVVGPGASPGLEATLRKLRPVPGYRRVLALIPSADPELALDALGAGADDVLPPPHSLSALLLRGLLLTSAGSAHPGGRGWGVGGAPDVVRVDPGSRRITSGEEARLLTGREYQLLERLVAASGNVVDRQKLLDDIWGDAAGTEAVLDATVHRLRRKLEFDPSRPDILTTVRGVGYRVDPNRLHFDPPPEALGS